MTTIAIAQVVGVLPAFLWKVGRSFREMFAGIEEARTLATRYKALARLTDGQLAERGLKRSDIPQVVLNDTVRA
jgi:hypothetical protein